MNVIIATSLKQALLRLSLLFMASVALASCVSPGRMMPPNEASWGQEGYSLEETGDYMVDVCGEEEISSIEEDIEFQKCMIDGGFNYLDERHDERLKEEGYRPASRDAHMCRYRWLSYSYDLPGCQQYRARKGIE